MVIMLPLECEEESFPLGRILPVFKEHATLVLIRNRLKPLDASLLIKGTCDEYKKHCMNGGQSESQFKGVLLQYAKDASFDLKQYRITR